MRKARANALKNPLNLMVLIVPFRPNVQVDEGGVTQTLEEMQEHFRRHLTDFLTMKLRVPDQPGTAAEVDRHLTETVVHRQAIAVALNSPFVAQGFADAFAQGNGSILDGVVLVLRVSRPSYER